tara:strand:- start:10526 stop:10909 length:384 start_codon:yes stop_codon:yes gene_type:complete
MKLWKIALFVLAATVSSCGTYNKKPKLKITHVLAITQTGDTLQIPIDAIRPVNYRIINYGYDYNWYRPYYHHNQYPIYTPSNNGKPVNNNNNNNNNNNINKPTQVNAPRPTPSVNPPATPVNPRKNP